MIILSKEKSKKESPPTSKNEKPKKKKKKDFRKTINIIPRFLVRQLYRMQYGYTKLNVFINILNTVSLLLLTFSVSEFFDVQWWHMLLLYVGIIFLLLITVFIFEIFGAWHTERKLIFNMQQSELWREQMELRSLLFAKYIKYSEEEIDERLEAVERRLFPSKFKD